MIGIDDWGMISGTATGRECVSKLYLQAYLKVELSNHVKLYLRLPQFS
jgi:hypothetical protein